MSSRDLGVVAAGCQANALAHAMRDLDNPQLALVEGGPNGCSCAHFSTVHQGVAGPRQRHRASMIGEGR